jgi:hypothetical protein
MFERLKNLLRTPRPKPEFSLKRLMFSVTLVAIGIGTAAALGRYIITLSMTPGGTTLWAPPFLLVFLIWHGCGAIAGFGLLHLFKLGVFGAGAGIIVQHILLRAWLSSV